MSSMNECFKKNVGFRFERNSDVQINWDKAIKNDLKIFFYSYKLIVKKFQKI